MPGGVLAPIGARCGRKMGLIRKAQGAFTSADITSTAEGEVSGDVRDGDEFFSCDEVCSTRCYFTQSGQPSAQPGPQGFTQYTNQESTCIIVYL